MGNSIQIVEVNNKKQLKQFIRCSENFYQDIESYISPLFLERSEILDAKKNPFYDHAEVKLWLALRDNKIVGRISAHIDLNNEKFIEEKIGCFGFFESINDSEVAEKLLENARTYLKSKHCLKIIGPLSFNTNEECGLLIDGFDKMQMVGTPYNPNYYQNLLESCHFKKLKDLYCWHFPTKAVEKAPQQIADAVAQYPGLTIRNLDKKNLKKDLNIIMDVFNEAWCNNWGYVKLTEAEVDKAAKDFEKVVNEKMIFIAEVHGEPAAICVGVENIYEIITDLKGKLLPFGWFKLLWRLKRHKYKSIRLAMLGIKKKFRGSVLGGLSVLLYVKFNEMGIKLDYDYGELGWTLEDNEKINQGIEFMGGKVYKTYRVYEQEL